MMKRRWIEVPDVKLYMIQVFADGDWSNYEKCQSLLKAIDLSFADLQGFSFRILGYYNERWVECLVSGTMLSVENKDFRKLAM